jgi:hypothetical protein
MEDINETPNKDQPFSAGYYVLTAAEALLKEASSDPRDYGKAWYLKELLIMERLLDSLRPGHIDVGDENFNKYDEREQEVRRKLGEFRKTLDPALDQEIVSTMMKLDEQKGELASNIHLPVSKNPNATVLEAYLDESPEE